MTSSIFALIGVVAGASLTFLFGVANDRARYSRELGIRWDSRTYEAYLSYTQAAVLTARTAGRLAANHGWSRSASPVNETTGLAELDQAERERTMKFEGVYLLGEGSAIEAGNVLNRTVWRMEKMARGAEEGSPEKWRAAVDEYIAALIAFHADARHHLVVRGVLPRTRDVGGPRRPDFREMDVKPDAVED